MSTHSKEQVVQVPVLNLFLEPSLESEVVSQALLGETLTLLEEKGEFFKVQGFDQYSGWVFGRSLTSGRFETDFIVSRPKAHLFSLPSNRFSPLLTLPYGAKIQVLEKGSSWLKVKLPDQSIGFIEKANVEKRREFSRAELLKWSSLFLNLPYTWGGRSGFGFDCSGFSQAIYQKMGITLPRDAKDQENDPRLKSIAIEDLRPMDLIFWGNESISHVAIYLENQKFIHASSGEDMPWLRISSLNDSAWNATGLNSYQKRVFKALR